MIIICSIHSKRDALKTTSLQLIRIIARVLTTVDASEIWRSATLPSWEICIVQDQSFEPISSMKLFAKGYIFFWGDLFGSDKGLQEITLSESN